MTITITAKIFKKYLDDILKGKKKIEYRQLGNKSEIILSDGERIVKAKITSITTVKNKSRNKIENRYPDVDFKKKEKILKIGIKDPKVIYREKYIYPF